MQETGRRAAGAYGRPALGILKAPCRPLRKLQGGTNERTQARTNERTREREREGESWSAGWLDGWRDGGMDGYKFYKDTEIGR